MHPLHQACRSKSTPEYSAVTCPTPDLPLSGRPPLVIDWIDPGVPRLDIHKQLITGPRDLRSFRNPRYAPGWWLSPAARRQDLRGLAVHSLRRLGSRTYEILELSGLVWFSESQSTTPDQQLHQRIRRSWGFVRVGLTSASLAEPTRTTSLSALTRAASSFRFNFAST